MAEVFVKPNHVVEHDQVLYGENEKAGLHITGLTDEQALALLKAGVCQKQDPAKGVSKLEINPTEEEIAAAAAAAGGPTEEEIAAAAASGGRSFLGVNIR